MKKFILLVLLFLMVGCTKSRTEVIDTLLDNGYSKNSVGAYERNDNDISLRFLYVSSFKDYSESAHRYFEQGPVLIMDKGDHNLNYHFNEDLMYYRYACKLDNGEGSTEIVYRFETSEFILTHDDCSYDTALVEDFYVEAANSKEYANEVIKNLKLTVKDLNNLKVE